MSLITKSFIVKKSDKQLYQYCYLLAIKYKAVYNHSLFFIRNLFSAMHKPVEQRFHNEIFVCHNIFNSINNVRTNKKKNLRFPSFTSPYISYETLDYIFKDMKDEVYYSLNTSCSQQAIKAVFQNMDSFFSAFKDYKLNPYKYSGKPKFPKYLKNFTTITLTNQACVLKQNKNGKCYLKFPKVNKISPKLFLGNFIKETDILKEVRIVPIHNDFKIELVLQVEQEDVQFKNPEKMIAIDVGTNNIATIVNNIGLSPMIIKGNVIKSYNHFFNKSIASVYSMLTKGSSSLKEGKQFTSYRISSLYNNRHLFFNDYFYKISHFIINYCKNNHIDTIVIGYNPNMKQNVNMGHINNQTFCFIPFKFFINTLSYLSNLNGINIKVREESYTSKASFLDNDFIPTYKKDDNTKYTFSGKRIKRGLYQSKNGTLLNADVVGACNILRKEYPSAFNKTNDFKYLQNVQAYSFKDFYNTKKIVCSKKR